MRKACAFGSQWSRGRIVIVPWKLFNFYHFFLILSSKYFSTQFIVDVFHISKHRSQLWCNSICILVGSILLLTLEMGIGQLGEVRNDKLTNPGAIRSLNHNCSVQPVGLSSVWIEGNHWRVKNILLCPSFGYQLNRFAQSSPLMNSKHK